MSHTTTIDAIQITDIAALDAAVKELRKSGIDIHLDKGGTPRGYFKNQEGMGQADYVLRLGDSPYDVGLYFNAEKKSYEARTDLFMGHVARVLGVPVGSGDPAQAALGRMYQMYAVHAATRQAVKSGYTVTRVKANDGAIKLVIGGIQ